ncbi:ribonuclease III [Fusarium beomiforme]|uniref:Ribonuclease III n=1 Tax=Fusarium beomiforme TaxID=44412 RepID=A0A9P5AQC2_9HYPO|nr:ribonuclease III [Fusarium beomiforme]
MPFCPIFSPLIKECQSIIGYTFKSGVLCAQALNADSIVITHLTDPVQFMPKNDRLAVYGDSAASLYLCGLWIEKGLAKNCWSTLRCELLSNENLSRVCKEHGLDKCINMNGGTTRVSSGMAATAVEAILGATEMDGGRNALATVMVRLGLTKHALISSVTIYLSLPRL